ncbi:MAG: response regulator [Spirochaetota bacterium]
MARILVVDDDDQICRFVSRVLETHGHETLTASSGKDALSALRDSPCDAMLLDLVMPEKGGIETIMEIRSTSPGLPIAVMSGRIIPGDASITRLVEHYGAIAVLAKPFTSEELVAAVDKALS